MNTGNTSYLLLFFKEQAEYVSNNHEYSYYYDLKTIDKQSLLLRVVPTLHVYGLFLLIP